MAFSINQVRHLFVASDPKTANGSVSDLGDTAPCGVAGKSLYFKHFGHGGVICSDKIDVENILSMKLSAGTKLNTPLYKNTLAVSSSVAGTVYTIKVLCQEFIGGVQDQRTIVASYTAADTTAANLAKGLRIALRKALGFQVADTAASEATSDDTGNIDNYKEALFTVTGSSTNVVISEVAPYWELGKFPAGKVIRIPEHGVVIDPSSCGSVTYAANGNAGDASKKLADLEYFCLGARADEYRGMGYPYDIQSKCEVNPSSNYDVIDIHYAYVGANESVQKSEKDITILVPKDNTAFASAIDSLTKFGANDPRRLVAAAGITVDPTSLTYTASAATKTVTATSDKPVLASSDSDWLTVTVSGSTISVAAAANNGAGAAARTGNVIVYNTDGASVTIPVSQAA